LLIVRGCGQGHAYPCIPVDLLRPHAERPPNSCATNNAKKFPPLHARPQA
jgi:hypothetical protein